MILAALEVARHWGVEEGEKYMEAMCRVQMAEAERKENGQGT